MAYKKYTAKQGDCVSNIAYRYGLLPDSIWDDSKNSELKRNRRDGNVLFPGDVVYIRDKEEKDESCSAETRHRFKRKAVPETLRIRFLDEDGQPRGGLPYTLDIDGMILEGTTGSNGVLQEHIPPDAKKALVTLGTGDEQETMEFNIGHLDPITEIAGVQGRLNNLGYSCGDEHGVLGEKTRRAISQFQDEHDLKVTGEPDDQTRKTLDKEHRC